LEGWSELTHSLPTKKILKGLFSMFPQKKYLFSIVLMFMSILDINSASSDWQDRENTHTQLANCFIEQKKCDLDRYPFSSLPYKKHDIFKRKGILNKIRS